MGILPIPRTHKTYFKKVKKAPPNPPRRGGLRIFDIPLGLERPKKA